MLSFENTFIPFLKTWMALSAKPLLDKWYSWIWFFPQVPWTCHENCHHLSFLEYHNLHNTSISWLPFDFHSLVKHPSFCNKIQSELETFGSSMDIHNQCEFFIITWAHQQCNCNNFLVCESLLGNMLILYTSDFHTWSILMPPK